MNYRNTPIFAVISKASSMPRFCNYGRKSTLKGILAVVFIFVLSLSVLSAFAPKVNAQSSSGDWPTFHADPSHDGIGTGNSVLSPTMLWKKTVGNYIESSPAVVDGAVYVGSYDDNVYAFNAANGGKLWNYSTGGFIASSPAVVGGIVYVGSYDDNVYALSAASGDKVWNYRPAPK